MNIDNYVGKIRKTTKEIGRSLYKTAALTALGLSSLMPYSQDARAQTLAEYQNIEQDPYIHVFVAQNRPAEGENNYAMGFNTLEEALNFDYAHPDNWPDKPIRIHIFPGNYKHSQGLNYSAPNHPLEVQIVAKGASVMNSDYTNGVTAPTTGTMIRTPFELINKSNVDLVNLVVIPDVGGEGIMLTGCEDIKVYNCHIGDVQSRTGKKFVSGITIGQTSGQITPIEVINNVIYRMYNPLSDAGSAIAVRGNAIFRDNIFAESKYGMDIYSTANIDLGTTTTPGNNVFVGNLTKNIQANIGDIEIIKAELNVWYDVGTISLASTSSRQNNYGSVLAGDLIRNTILILNSTPQLLSKYDYSDKTESTSSLDNYLLLQGVKEVDFIPWKLGDIRFGYAPPTPTPTPTPTPVVITSVNDWEIYD